MPDTDIIGYCWHCAKGLPQADYGRETLCLGCGKPTRVCRNCRFFAQGRPNDCIEPMAEPVSDKTKANFCDFFVPSSHPKDAATGDTAESLREAANALFKF